MKKDDVDKSERKVGSRCQGGGGWDVSSNKWRDGRAWLQQGLWSGLVILFGRHSVSQRKWEASSLGERWGGGLGVCGEKARYKVVI